jgi:hypothetical protein
MILAFGGVLVGLGIGVMAVVLYALHVLDTWWL